MELVKQFESLFGKSTSDAEVQAFLAQIGETKPVEFPEEDGEIDTSAYVSRKEQGYSILFKDCSFIRNPKFENQNAGLPVFCTVFLYGEGHPRFTKFAGALPSGINFGMTAEEVVKVLGDPSDGVSDDAGVVYNQRWDDENLSLHVTYHLDRPGIKVIGYGIVQKF